MQRLTFPVLLWATLGLLFTGCRRYEYRPYFGGCEDTPVREVLRLVGLPDSPQLIRGHVVDRGGRAPLQYARVKLDPLDRTAIADSSGAFLFDSVPPGAYTLTVRRLGYGTTSVASIRVSSMQGMLVHFPLAINMSCPTVLQRVRKPWWRFW